MGNDDRNVLLVLACVALAGPGQAQLKPNIICSGDQTFETALVSLEIKYFDGHLHIERCPPPAVSYAATLAVLLDITALHKLALYDMPVEPPLQRTHFTGLALSKLTIMYPYSASRNYTSPDISFLDAVTSMTVVLFNVNLLPLPQTVLMEKMELWYGQSLGAWGGCSNLRELRLNEWDVARVPERWLAHCSKLTVLWIRSAHQLTSQALGRAVGGATNLLELQIYDYELEKFDVELADLVNLRRLNLAWNSLWNISAAALPTSLTSLDLMGNQLWNSDQVAEVLQRLPALQDLSIDRNEELDLCDESTKLEAGAHRATLQQLVLPSIVRLSAVGTATRRLCFGAMQTHSLTSLDLRDNDITQLKFRDLPVSKALRLELNMGDTSVRDVALEQADYEMLRDRVVVTGMELSLACGCEHLWLARAVREGRVVIENTRCSDGTALADVSAERVQSDKFSCAGGACTCWRSRCDNATVARCTTGALRTVPRIPGLRALHAAGNRVRALSADDLPDSLLLLDLSGNNVSRADAAAAAALFARPGRRVRLARNPLRCACENRALLAALHENRTQVEDFVDVTCNEGGIEVALRDVLVILAELCTRQGKENSWLTLALAVSVALVGLAVLAAGLYYRYGRIIVVYIFSHGWCLNCVREEQLDPDRPFDAFVSFAHEDYEFVTRHLLPGLESEPRKYRLCVHTRDWVPGEQILAQIARSVRLSRRTIIVLSRNFLQSVWGLLEFRMAHVSALSEGRVRVIVVVLDDVLDEGGLDPELLTYLRTHTYVQWGDTWFWRKLRYALPHRSARAQRTEGAHATAQADTRARVPKIELLALPERVLGNGETEISPF